MAPFRYLGEKLRRLREGKSESLHDVSDAVEIETAKLQQIESGRERPTEDILLMLCNHFETEAATVEELWNLAGYTGKPGHDQDDGVEGVDRERIHIESPPQSIQAVMMMLDPRVIYSDGVEAVAGDRGVTLHFSQMGNGPAGKPLVVSRIGMSRLQAEQLMGVLHQVLYNLDNPNQPQLGGGEPDNTNS